MKILKDHININESFERNNAKSSSDKLGVIGIGKIELIKKWLDEHRIFDYTINNDMTIDLIGSTFKNHDLELHSCKLTEFPSYIQFGHVKGWVDLRDNKLTSLRGCPKNIGGFFDCAYNNLKSLEGGPEKVGGDYMCFSNLDLVSLEGAPRLLYPSFIFKCEKTGLTKQSLIDYKKNNKIFSTIISDFVGNDFSEINRTKQLEESFIRNNDDKLKSIGVGHRKLIEKWMDENVNLSVKYDYEINYDFSIDVFVKGQQYFNLPDNIGNLPEYIQFNYIDGSMDCTNCKLTSLRGMPKKVTRDFICRRNNLISLDYAPTEIGEDFNCKHNLRISKKEVLKYLEQSHINGDFICDFDDLNVDAHLE
jgi:hypothetical protein